MTTGSQRIVRKAAVAIALVSLMTVMIQAPAVGRVVAATQPVSFEVADPTIGFSAALSTAVDWSDEQSVKKGNVAILTYSLSSEQGTASVEIPLSEIPFLGLEDEIVTVPLPDVPLGSTSISLTQYLAGIPSSITSINLVLVSSIRMISVTASSDSLDMLTDINTLTWTSWGSKSVQLLTSESGPITVRATLEYTISLGIDVTILGESYALVSSTPIAGVAGTPALSTTLLVKDDSTLMLFAGIGAVGAGVAGVAALFVIRRRSRKIKSEKTESEKALERVS